MIDGSLALFHVPQMAFYETLPSLLANSRKDESSTMNIDDVRKQWVIDALEVEEQNRVGNLVLLVPPPKPDDPLGSQYFITCASFGKNGDVVWAVTK